MIFILAFSLNMDVVILRENITGSDKSFHLKYILKLGERERSVNLGVAGCSWPWSAETLNQFRDEEK